MNQRALALDEVAAWSGPPLILFVGVDTGGSLVHPVFGRWAEALGQPWILRGVDLPADTPAGTYLRLVETMRANRLVHGAIVTAHKLRLYRACASALTRRDRLVDLTHEINTLTTVDGTVTGDARDAVSLTHVLPTVPRHHTGGRLDGLHLLCLGSGGAATALLLALHLDPTTGRPRADLPAHTTFTDTDPDALDALRAVAQRAGIQPARLSYAHVHDRTGNDALVASLPAPALVINATGLGKDTPGSPLTHDAPLRPGTVAWDFNYRGDLTFLRQARAAGATTVDGWDYFVAGWAGGLTAIAGTPLTSDLLTRLSRAAAGYRPSTPRQDVIP
ncbi:MAG: shikimate dehydrogenase [Micromonosporaceae bacterium]